LCLQPKVCKHRKGQGNMSKLVINKNFRKSKIDKNIYGHFSEHLGRCIYGGLFLDGKINMPVIEALKKINIPVLRWPGGCFADEYHWKDGIGPKEKRKKMVNTHWGGVTEDNSFGTHEFMELCELLGCEPYVNGNLGSGTVQEMSEWVEYMTLDGVSPMAALRAENGRKEPWSLKYFGVGNENWGCGGHMRPEYYADEYRRYQTYVRSYGANKIYKIACGSSGLDYNWTDVLMDRAGKFMDGLSLHHYTVPLDWSYKGKATDFDLDTYYMTLDKALLMDELIENHSRIMDRYDPEVKVDIIVDEWGTWYEVEPDTNPGFLFQQNTMRDAIVAACTLNIFNLHSRRVTMANLAQTINVLQAVILTEGEKFILTPTYHVFDLYKAHQDATLIDSYVEAFQIGGEKVKVPNLHVSASVNENDVVTVTLANLSATDSQLIECENGYKPEKVSARILTGAMDAHNDFDSPDNVTIKDFSDIKVHDNGFNFTIPACAVMEITVK